MTNWLNYIKFLSRKMRDSSHQMCFSRPFKLQGKSTQQLQYAGNLSGLSLFPTRSKIEKLVNPNDFEDVKIDQRDFVTFGYFLSSILVNATSKNSQLEHKISRLFKIRTIKFVVGPHGYTTFLLYSKSQFIKHNVYSYLLLQN